MKYTAKQLKLSLMKNDDDTLSEFKVNKYDRDYLPIAIRIGKGNL
jgi:hypothetical protein